MRRWEPGIVEFGEPVNVRAQDPVTAVVWEGHEQQAHFPKPGGGVRATYLVHSLVTPQETQAILQAAVQLVNNAAQADGRFASRKDVMVSGQYQCAALASHVRPIVDTRLLPYIRHRYACPGAVVSDIFIRADAPSDCTDSPVDCNTEHLAYCTAVLALNLEDSEGGLYIQSSASVDSQSIAALKSSDVMVHQYDLKVGLRACGSKSRYSLVFHFKDSILACLTNTAPWYENMAEEGDADAQMNLAVCLESGPDVKGQDSDLASAVQWYRRAAEQGHADAQDRLGAFYSEGIGGLKRDFTQAVNWWHKAALQGHRSAQRNLAEMLLRGKGTAKNELEAIKWIEKSAAQADADAMYLLCIAHASGRGVSVDKKSSLAWCERAALRGNAAAQYYLGSHYFAGEGLARDMCEAVKWFQRAARSGHTGAQCNLGVCFAQGLGGLPRDFTRASHWYEQAANANDPHAQYNLAVLHASGLCDSKNILEAQRWCKRAAARGHAQAKALLPQLSEGRCNIKVPNANLSRSLVHNSPCRSTPDDDNEEEVIDEGIPPIKLNDCQRTRLRVLLSELQNMRAGSLQGQTDELISILRVVEVASQLEEVTEQIPAPPAPASPHERAAPEPVAPEPVEPETVAPVTASEPESVASAEAIETACPGEPTPAVALPLAAQPAASEPEAVTQRRYAVNRVSAHQKAELLEAINSRRPVLVTGAMPHLTGAKVPEFMPKLMSAAGTLSTTFEIQGSQGEVLQTRQAPLAMYIQELSKSMPGNAYLMISEEALQSPNLSDFLAPPACCDPSILHDLPAVFQPSSGRYLVVGGKGAMCQLHRDPVMWAGWNLLVLGRKRWHLLPPHTPRQALSAQDGPCGIAASPCNSFSAQDKSRPSPGLAEEVWEATQEMGEVLLIPPGWWHQTFHEDRTLAVMSQFVTDGAVLSAVADEVVRWLSADNSLRNDLRAEDPHHVLEQAAKQAMARADTVQLDRRATLRHTSLLSRDNT